MNATKTLPQQRLTNECRWSSSRESTFKECRKKYWYTYYGAWEGWPKNACDTRSTIDPLSSYLYMLKNMQPACMFMGSVVHKTIEWSLKTYQASKKLPSLEEAFAHVLGGCKKGFSDSSQKLWKKHPKYHVNLFEHYYHQPIDMTSIEEKAHVCITNWFSSPCLLNVAMSPKAEWKGIESVQTFSLERGVEAIVVYDFFLMWHKNALPSSMIIFDWKTGQESVKVENQLFAYAIAAQKCFGVNLEDIILSPFYLSQGPNGYKKYGKNQENPVDAIKLERVKENILCAAKDMLALHPEKNGEGMYGTPDPRLFSYTEDKRSCRKCSFQELCQAANYQEKEARELAQLIENIP